METGPRLKVRVGHRVGPRVGRVSVLVRRNTIVLTFFLCRYQKRPCGDPLRRWPFAQQEEDGHQKVNLTGP